MNTRVVISGLLFFLALLFSVFGGNIIARGFIIEGIVCLTIGFIILIVKWKNEAKKERVDS